MQPDSSKKVAENVPQKVIAIRCASFFLYDLVDIAFRAQQLLN